MILIEQKRKREYFDWALYDNNIFELFDVCPNFTYFGKTSLTCFQILKEQDHKLWITWNIYILKN